MLPRRGIVFSKLTRAPWLIAAVLFFAPADLLAEQSRSSVLVREEVSPAHREQLSKRLRKITGLPGLKFDSDGALRLTPEVFAGGSETARRLLIDSVSGRNVIVIEEANDSSQVAFCRVVPGQWRGNFAAAPPVFVVQIDFADFDQLVGDDRALESFNPGWGLLHELDHVVHDSSDATAIDETGECESHLNQMRRECNLPARVSYFFTLLPVKTETPFITRLVRLAFEERQPPANKMKRYWIVWDAKAVGGLEQNQVAALR